MVPSHGRSHRRLLIDCVSRKEPWRINVRHKPARQSSECRNTKTCKSILPTHYEIQMELGGGSDGGVTTGGAGLPRAGDQEW